MVLTPDEAQDCKVLTDNLKTEDKRCNHTILSYCTGEYNEDDVTTAERLHCNGVLSNLQADDREQVSQNLGHMYHVV
jgi:hypothetical protein